MRSSRHKLKLLRAIGNRSHHGISPKTVLSSTSPISPLSPNRKTATRHRSLSHEESRSKDENFLMLNSVEIMDVTREDEVKVKAYAICRDYLNGAWKQLLLRDLGFKRISGGLSNYLFHCSLPSTLLRIGNEPEQVLLRFYGQDHGEDALESLIKESVIFALLSERKLGPKLYGLFPGGRIEQFLPARPLRMQELSDPELSKLISKKMAQIHALNIPISKDGSWLWATIDRWLVKVNENLPKASPSSKEAADIVLKISQIDFKKEILWLRSYLESVESPIVFCHNDLQEGNILLRPDVSRGDEKLAIIDFEYCSYNYRGFDLANHFCEWTYNYGVEEYPNFSYTESAYPTQDQMMSFIKNYVKVLREEFSDKKNGCRNDPLFSTLFSEEHILKEVKVFTLASHFLWMLWAVMNAQISKIPFGYWESANSRLDCYFQLKKAFV